MLKTTPLLDELSAHGQACIDAVRTFATPANTQTEVLETLYALGYNALSLEKYEDAHVIFSYLVAQNAANANYLAGLGHALSGLGELDAAALMQATAASLNLDNPGHYIALADTLIALKELQKAEFVLAFAESGGASASLVQKMRTKLVALKELLANAN